jgi:hypothetical protein
MKYQIFSATSPEELEIKITEKINDGFILIGGLAANGNVLYQAAIKDDLLADVERLVHSGHVLEAVKLYKEKKGVDILTAKKFVESIQR